MHVHYPCLTLWLGRAIAEEGNRSEDGSGSGGGMKAGRLRIAFPATGAGRGLPLFPCARVRVVVGPRGRRRKARKRETTGNPVLSERLEAGNAWPGPRGPVLGGEPALLAGIFFRSEVAPLRGAHSRLAMAHGAAAGRRGRRGRRDDRLGRPRPHALCASARRAPLSPLSSSLSSRLRFCCRSGAWQRRSAGIPSCRGRAALFVF